MDRQKALHILNLSEPAEHNVIQRQYNFITTDLRQRISDAPPHLRVDFEAALKEAEAAYMLLMGSVATDHWLPSAGRVVAPTITAPTPDIASPAAISPPAFQSSMTNQAARPEFLQRAGKWFFGGMIAALVLAVFFGIRSMNLQKELNKTKPLAESAEKMQKTMQNGKFKLKNASTSTPFVVQQAKVYYIKDDSLTMAIVIKGSGDKPPVVVDPGDSFNAKEDMVGSHTVYDGEVLFYSVILSDINQTISKSYSGICQDDNGFKLDPKFENQ